ncbi:hypothetical protein M0R45_019727 [Rubus argutus]|uniref:Uncharacterized protein n=1 Tax=Rubus argutus TaxID=59490 RepID=A0AAW1X671_RUBAR
MGEFGGAAARHWRWPVCDVGLLVAVAVALISAEEERWQSECSGDGEVMGWEDGDGAARKLKHEQRIEQLGSVKENSKVIWRRGEKKFTDWKGTGFVVEMVRLNWMPKLMGCAAEHSDDLMKPWWNCLMLWWLMVELNWVHGDGLTADEMTIL